MIYLINISDGYNIVYCKFENSLTAKIFTEDMKEIGIDLYEVNFIAYWLQKHSFFKLAALFAIVIGP